MPFQNAARKNRPETAPSAARAMKRFERVCAARQILVTPTRRRIFEALVRSPRPLGAYDLTDMVPGRVERLSPISVYRTLDLLIEAGLVRRLATTSMFTVADEDERPDAWSVALIDTETEQVRQVVSRDLTEAIAGPAKDRGFSVRSWTLEITGRARAPEGDDPPAERS